MRALFSGLLPLFVLAHLSHHLVTALPGPLLPYIRDEFALDYTRAGFIMSAFGVVYGICQLPGGWLADRFGPRILLTVGIVGVSITGLLVGMSPNYLVLLAGLVLMGILGGGYHPAATTMISAAVAPESRGQALGYHMVGGSTSYFLAPLIAAGVAGAWGWRSPFIVLAILGIGFGIFLHVVLKKRVPLQKAATPGTSVSTEAPPAPGNLRRVITLIAMSSFTQAMVIAIISFIPLFLVDTYNTSKETAAASISLIYFMGLWAAPFGGYLSDRFGRITIIIAMGVMASIMVYLLNVVPYGFGIGAVLVFTGIALYFNTTVAQAYIVDETPIKRRSTMLGFYFFANMEGAGILTPVLGYLIDHFSFYTSFAFSSAAIVAVLIVCSTLLWLGRR
ncbi:Multidrug resistance protein MdtG [subsurface metagenome]